MRTAGPKKVNLYAVADLRLSVRELEEFAKRCSAVAPGLEEVLVDVAQLLDFLLHPEMGTVLLTYPEKREELFPRLDTERARAMLARLVPITAGVFGRRPSRAATGDGQWPHIGAVTSKTFNAAMKSL